MDDLPSDNQTDDGRSANATMVEPPETQENSVLPLNYASPQIGGALTKLADMLIELLFIGGFFTGLLANFVAICRVSDRSFRNAPVGELCCEFLAFVAFIMFVITLVTSGQRARMRWVALMLFLGLVALLLFCVYM